VPKIAWDAEARANATTLAVSERGHLSTSYYEVNMVSISSQMGNERPSAISLRQYKYDVGCCWRKVWNKASAPVSHNRARMTRFQSRWQSFFLQSHRPRTSRGWRRKFVSDILARGEEAKAGWSVVTSDLSGLYIHE
jgi:hypothetical protein